MNRTLLLLVPGQGSHFQGMGLDLLSQGDTYLLDYLTAASDLTGYDLRRAGENLTVEEFNRSEVVQPLITSLSLAYWARLSDHGYKPTMVLGHSLGEITALAFSGVLSPIETVEFSAYRGKQMDLCASACGGGGMSAVLMAEKEVIAEEINRLGLQDKLYIVNENAPNQIVVSGLTDALDLFSREFPQRCRCKIQPLAVAGPWHTPFIAEGREAFVNWVSNRTLNKPNIPLVMNSTATQVDDPEEIRQRISDQLVLPVYWSRCLHYCATKNIDDVIEIGPGKILAGTLRANKVKRSFENVYSLSNLSEIDDFIKKDEC